MGANQNISRKLAYIPKLPQIHSTKSRRAAERKIDIRTHAVMPLGEKPIFKRRVHDCKTQGETIKLIASDSARRKTQSFGHTSNEYDGTWPGRPLHEVPRNPVALKMGQSYASTAVSGRTFRNREPETNREEPKRKTGGDC
jgi:hypothetical protein